MNKSTLNKNIITALCGKSPKVFRTKLPGDDLHTLLTIDGKTAFRVRDVDILIDLKNIPESPALRRTAEHVNHEMPLVLIDNPRVINSLVTCRVFSTHSCEEIYVNDSELTKLAVRGASDYKYYANDAATAVYAYRFNELAFILMCVREVIKR